MSIKFFLCMMFAGIAYPKTPVWTFQPNLIKFDNKTLWSIHGALFLYNFGNYN